MIGRLARAFGLRPPVGGGARFRRQNPTIVTSSPESQGALRRDARAVGRENLPTSRSTAPTEYETEIIRSLERLHRDRGEPALAEVQRIAAEFTAIEATLPGERDLTDRVVAAAGDVDREVGSAGELAALWAEREGRLRDLRVFARERGLARDARYPASRLLHLSLVAALFVIESVANAQFFAEASDFGLFGGFLGACVVALANVASAFITGWLVVPRVFHGRRLARAFFFALLLGAVAFAGVLNLAAAGFRDRLAEGTITFASLHDLLHDPFSISFTSALLLGMGAVIWTLGVYKGHSFDDECPDYGKLDRRFREADRKFTEVRSDLVTRVVVRVQGLPVDLQVELGRGRAALSRLDAAAVEAHRVWHEYETDRLDLEGRCTSLLKAWREENAFVRTTPPPGYFRDYPAFSTIVPEGLVKGLADRAARARVRHEELDARAHAIVLENGERVSTALARVEAYVANVMHKSGRGDGPAGGSCPPEGRAGV